MSVLHFVVFVCFVCCSNPNKEPIVTEAVSFCNICSVLHLFVCLFVCHLYACDLNWFVAPELESGFLLCYGQKGEPEEKELTYQERMLYPALMRFLRNFFSVYCDR